MDIKFKMIDVSAHNGTIDFAKVKSDGIQGVIIRAGYGVSTVDKNFHANIKNALANGLHVGVYWFGYAYTVVQAEKEAQFCINTLKPYSGKVDLPIFYDWEYDSYNYAKKQGVTVSKQLCSDMTAKFCDTLENNGYFSGFYANVDYLNRFYTDTVKQRYTLWVAQWSSYCTYGGNFGIWQYGAETNKIDSKTVNGISGVVDKDYCYIDYPTIIKNGGFNGYSKTSTVDTSNYHYDVNNDGSINNQDLSALQDYLEKADGS
jgi:GH25 family lysozyme M1 (1,4-beta-N-acetylmuramidase)